MATSEQKVEKADKIYQKLQEISTVGDSIYWSKAEMYHDLKKNGLYKYVFGDEDGQSWASFCSEIGVPVSSADQKIKNWEFFVLKHKIPLEQLTGFDTSCLYYIARYKGEASNEEVVDEIDKIKLLGRTDFIKVITGRSECAHEKKKEESKTKCADCNQTLKINE